MRPTYALHSWITIAVFAAIATVWPSPQGQESARDTNGPAAMSKPAAVKSLWNS